VQAISDDNNADVAKPQDSDPANDDGDAEVAPPSP
jgi:hypothetical protein